MSLDLVCVISHNLFFFRGCFIFSYVKPDFHCVCGKVEEFINNENKVIRFTSSFYVLHIHVR